MDNGLGMSILCCCSWGRDLDLFFVLGGFVSGGLQNLFSNAMFNEN